MGACQTCLFKTCFAPKGTLVGTGIPDDPFSAQVGWDEEKFGEVRTVTLADEAQARSGLERCAKLVRQMKIFDPTLPQPTAVTMRDRKPEIELDMLIAVTTWLGGRYFTSLERVSVMEHAPGDSFVVCLSGCIENVIDGYYRVRLHRTGATITIDYAKVQSLSSPLMRVIVGRKQYGDVNRVSAQATAELLAGYVANSGDGV